MFIYACTLLLYWMLILASLHGLLIVWSAGLWAGRTPYLLPLHSFLQHFCHWPEELKRCWDVMERQEFPTLLFSIWTQWEVRQIALDPAVNLSLWMNKYQILFYDCLFSLNRLAQFSNRPLVLVFCSLTKKKWKLTFSAEAGENL